MAGAFGAVRYTGGMRHFLVLFLILAAAPGQAGDLTLFGGMQSPGKLTISNVTSAPITLDPRNFGTFGLRFSQGTVVGSEHTLAYSPNFISSENNAFIYNSNLYVQAPLPGVRPYGTAGLGTVRIGGDGLEDIITGGKFAINYGGGVKIGGSIGVQFDARGYRILSVADESLNVLETTIGVVFSF
jgi:hypothetical protein